MQRADDGQEYLLSARLAAEPAHRICQYLWAARTLAHPERPRVDGIECAGLDELPRLLKRPSGHCLVVKPIRHPVASAVPLLQIGGDTPRHPNERARPRAAHPFKT